VCLSDYDPHEDVRDTSTFRWHALHYAVWLPVLGVLWFVLECCAEK